MPKFTGNMAKFSVGGVSKRVICEGETASDSAKLGGKLPDFYAKKTEVDAAAKRTDLMMIGSKGYANNANNIQNGVTWCNVNTPTGSHCLVWQIQYDSANFTQLAFPTNVLTGPIAFRSTVGTGWSLWTQMLSGTSGGVYSVPSALTMDSNNLCNIYLPGAGTGAGIGMIFLRCSNAGGVRVCSTSSLDGYLPIAASAFQQASSIEGKESPTEYSGALEVLETAKFYEYTRKSNGERQIGLIVEDESTPQEVIITQPKIAEIETNKKMRSASSADQTESYVDLYSLISMTAQAVKELKTEKDAEIAALTARIEALEGKV